MAIELHEDKLRLLTKINQYTESNRRTDRLAECMKQFGKHWTPSHVAFIGLQLRAVGYVTTFKDNGVYAQWNITPLGKAALAEVRNVGKAAQIDAQERDTLRTLTPPTKRVDKFRAIELSDGSVSEPMSLAEARKLAEKWAVETPGNAVEIVGVFETVKAKVIIDKE